MADPLGMAASVAGIISLADVVFRTVYKYYKGAKDAKGDIHALAEEINGLSAVLRSLQALASELEAEGDAFDPTLRNHYLSHCKATLDRVEKRVKKGLDNFSTKSSKLDGFVRQLKWPFSSSETKEIMGELSRHKHTITVALSADSMRKLQVCLSKVDELAKGTSAIAEAVKRIDINTQIALDYRKEKVLDFFMRVSPQPNLEMSIKLRHSMTGLWLTESPNFGHWLETPGSRLWLSGIPGAGKTVLAGAVIQEALTRSYAVDGVGVGFFFCDYKDFSTWDTANILGAVASQLARQNDEAFGVLQNYYDELHPPRGLEKTPDSSELRARISRMSELFDQAIIIVDGLDECGDQTDEVVEVLSDLAEYTTGVSIALFSRDHYNIRVHLEADFEHVEIAAHTDDIRLYVGAELDKRIRTRRLQLTNIEIKDEIMETLVNRAQGMFRWVVCQLDYLCDCAHDAERREALTRLPPDLPESYRRLLERVNRCSTRVQTMVQMCLRFIAFAEPKMTILQLRQAVSTPEVTGSTLDASNTMSEHEISRRCSSLIRKSEDDEYFEFAHFSVKEFLEHEGALAGTPDRTSLESYFIDEEESRELLAAQCLRCLQLKNFNRQPTEVVETELEMTRKRDSEYPFYEYSALQWLKLTKHGLDLSPLLDLAKSLFHPSKTAYFSSWAIQAVCHMIYQNSRDTDQRQRVQRACSTVLEPSFRPLHLASALNIPEICAVLLDGGAAVNARSGATRPLDLAMVSVVGMAEHDNPTPESRDISYRVSELESYSQFLPTAERRNQTLDCLIAKGAKPSSHTITFGTLSLFSITSVLCTYFNDLTPVTRLLSLGTIPGSTELDVLRKCFKSIDVTNYDEEEEDISEASSLELVQYLTDSKLYTSDWGSQVASIVWNWALTKGFDYTNNTFLLDSRISLSQEALVVKALAAVRNAEVDVLARCLADDRLDKAGTYDDHGGTLLHLAAKSASSEAMVLLLEAGCDPYIEDENGDLPLHQGVQHGWTTTIIELFHKRGLSLLSPDRQGRNIWHLWADDLIVIDDFLEKTQRIAPHATAKAMSVKTREGDTPLTLVLKQHVEPGSDPEDIIDKATRLVEYCRGIPDFWKHHPPVFGLAAALGSEEVLSCLIDGGAEPDPVGCDNLTPLHQMGAYADVGCVEMLKTLYEDACELRHKERLPFEFYLERVLEANDDIEQLEAVVEELTHDSLLPELWEFVCGMLNTAKGARISLDNSYYNYTRHDTILALSVTLGAAGTYENQRNESGLIPLLSGFLDHHRWLESPTMCCSVDTLRLAIQLTGRLASAIESNAAIRFFKLAIKDGNLPMVELLLEHGFNIHQRIDGTSAIEYVCQASRALRLCPSENGKRIISALLDHSNVVRLKEFTPDEKGLGLLHRLATPKNASEILWLIRELVQRGVDVNAQSQGSPRRSVLVHHINLFSFQCAEALMDLGADPTLVAPDENAMDAAQAATLNGNVSFLNTLLAHTTTTATAAVPGMDWARNFGITAELNGESLSFAAINSLHLASFVGELECVQFYLDQGLINDIETTSAEGHTPLHFAAIRNFVQVIDFLVSRGAHVMARAKDESTPLHLAARNGHLPVVKTLLHHGATESPDALVMSPRMYAARFGHQDIVEYLEENLGPDTTTQALPGQQHDPSLSQRHIKLSSKALQHAIISNNLNECKRLVTSGCPVNVTMPRCGGCSPLILAISTATVEIVEWLLDIGASTVKAACQSHGLFTPIEMAIGKVQFNSVISKLVERYLGEGGDLVCGDDYPLHHALWSENTQGLELLLQCIEANVEKISRTCSLGRDRVLGEVVNRRAPSFFSGDRSGRVGQHNSQATPLHIAAQANNSPAVSILVERGAIIDNASTDGWTPLVYSRPDMAAHLMRLGASPSELYLRGPLSSLLSWWGTNFPQLFSLYFCDDAARSKLDMSMFVTVSTSRCPTACEDINLNPQYIPAFAGLNCDLTVEDDGGRSLMHCIICKDEAADVVLNWDYGLNKTSPFPWHLEWCGFGSIAFLRSRFDAFRGKLGDETFRKMLNLHPKRGWSPLCRAASLDLVDVVDNCLIMGAEIDFEGSPLGSALMVAGACGSAEAVKLLVRKGARLCYSGFAGPTNIMALIQSKAVKRWLLVERFSEQRRIEPANRHSWSGVETHPWSGVAQAQLRLTGKRQMQPHESSLDYAKRLARIRSLWQGKVVPSPDGLVYPVYPAARSVPHQSHRNSCHQHGRGSLVRSTHPSTASSPVPAVALPGLDNAVSSRAQQTDSSSVASNSSFASTGKTGGLKKSVLGRAKKKFLSPWGNDKDRGK